MSDVAKAIETVQDMLDVLETAGSCYVYKHNGGADRLRNVLDSLRDRQERENPKLLTIEELLHMDGEPVWDNFLMEWCVIMAGKGAVKYFDGGFNWLSEKRFFLRKPKEAMK